MKRYLEGAVLDDLREKMVFLGGPRQVGKTTLALRLLRADDENHPAYLNWDTAEAKRSLLRGELPSAQSLIVLDEIHKYKGWRNLVKGFYDRHRRSVRFLITGSARLDYYRRGGDSLQGRYHYRRLHPLTAREIGKNPADMARLLTYGGFPEPFFKASDRHYKRWQREHKSRVIQEDLITLERVREVSQMELLMDLLPDRVGSVLSVNNLRQDLSVAFETAEHWLAILERLYYCYRIRPYGLSSLRAAKKEKKLYLWDWSGCGNPAARFENFVASHLLKYCHDLEDGEGDVMELAFLRDAAGREIDFVVLKDRKPVFAVECKTGETSLSRNISYFAARTPIPLFYQVHSGRRDFEVKASRARVLPFATLCAERTL